MTDIPEWMEKHIQDARRLFGLGGSEWSIFAKLNDRPNRSDDAAGVCFADAVYLNADIEFLRSMEDTEASRRHIYHEVLHVAHHEIDELVEEAINTLPKRERRIYKHLYLNLVERFLQRMSRNICENIKAK